VPDWAGLQEWNGERFTFALHAPKLSKSAPSWDFVSSVYRTAGRMRRDSSIEMRELRAKLHRAEMRLRQLTS